MLRTFFLSSLFAGSAFTCLHAQTPGTTEWSNVPFTEQGNIPMSVLTSPCVDGVSYAFATMALGKNEYVGYIFPKNGQAMSTPVDLPDEKGRTSFSGFGMLGNTPCVVYNTWDKKSGDVTLFAQGYTSSSFAPIGQAVKLGAIPLSKSYQGSALNIRTTPSPDGSKMLFLFDDLQMGGIKLALCWVVDSELNLLWSGQYRIPMQSHG
ncbi:MAG: hypothetical protein ABIQ75_11090, partial [Flavobacteriales bacterium]